jgi:hypothetical protein
MNIERETKASNHKKVMGKFRKSLGENGGRKVFKKVRNPTSNTLYAFFFLLVSLTVYLLYLPRFVDEVCHQYIVHISCSNKRWELGCSLFSHKEGVRKGRRKGS